MTKTEEQAKKMNPDIIERLQVSMFKDYRPEGGLKTAYYVQGKDYNGSKFDHYLVLWPSEWNKENKLVTGKFDIDGEEKRFVISARESLLREDHGWLRIPYLTGEWTSPETTNENIANLMRSIAPNLQNRVSTLYAANNSYLKNGIWVNLEGLKKVANSVEIRPTQFMDYDKNFFEQVWIGTPAALKCLGVKTHTDDDIKAGIHFISPFEDDTLSGQVVDSQKYYLTLTG